MWNPTHIQVLVKKATDLKVKGKDGTNDAFVTIGIGKERYQTSVKEKSSKDVQWNEQCELAIPYHGNTAEVALNVLHKNFMGVDEFLGMVSIPLGDMEVTSNPKTAWYDLKCKPGHDKTGYRGKLEVRTSFTVKPVSGSTMDLSSKGKRGSLASVNKAVGSIGGSLLNIGKRESRNVKKIAKSVTNKVERAGHKAKASISSRHRRSQDKSNYSPSLSTASRRSINNDPGIHSDDENSDMEGGIDDDDMFTFDALSHCSSRQSLNMSENLGTVSKTSTPMSGSLENFSPNDIFSKKKSGLAGGSQSPLVTNSKAANDNNDQEDDWDKKLMGKKSSIPYMPAKSNDTQSLNSGNSRTSTLEKRTLPIPGAPPVPQENPEGVRKKIIPVASDFDSTPSPDGPSSPVSTPKTEKSFNGEDNDGKKKKKLNFRWKSNVSFKEKETGGSADGKFGQSSESLNQKSHSRNHSDGSGSSNNAGPPGTRVAPLGRETTPTPNAPKRIPQEVWDRFGGKSREDLIETVVQLQSQLEIQGKKQSDLEDYLDALLMKVMNCAPQLLQKNANSSDDESGSKSASSLPRGLFRSWMVGRH